MVTTSKKNHIFFGSYACSARERRGSVLTSGDNETQDYRYFLVLKKNREFKVVAIDKNKDPNIMLIRYNAAILLELTIHEYFDYTYKFYDGNLQYFNQRKKL